MKTVFDAGKSRRSINFIDNICYSRVTDLTGAPLPLFLSLMVQNGNSEMRLADGRDDEVSTGRQPLIVYINGAGWRGCDKNLMAAEMNFLAEAGFAVACVYYRSSAQGRFPTQLIDCKTAVRFLRAHADEYGIDPDRVGAIGRSAGGHLTAWLAMNTDEYESEEWQGYSDHIQAGADLFGPVDIPACSKINMELVKDPKFRWHSMKETHEGALLGLTDGMSQQEIFDLGAKASPINAISDRMSPLLIMHGDQDPLVPCFISEQFYDRLVKAGLADRADLYIMKGAGHGTREFFQTSTKQIIVDFYKKYLKGETTHDADENCR